MASGVKGRVPLDSGVRARRHGITMKSPGNLGQVSSPPWASVSLSVKSGAQRRGALVSRLDRYSRGVFCSYPTGGTKSRPPRESGQECPQGQLHNLRS